MDKEYLKNFDYNLEKPGDTVKYWVEAQERINLDNKIKLVKLGNLKELVAI